MALQYSAVLGGPIDQTVLLGETANFTCAASGSSNLIFILSHETQGILTVNEEVGLNAEITNSTLMVANTSIESRGRYWCNVIGEGKNIRSHSGILTVQGKQYTGNKFLFSLNFQLGLMHVHN